jgi:hypothetical protein
VLCDDFYSHLAGLLSGNTTPGGALYIAVGTGQESWDRLLPPYRRGTVRFAREIARKAVAPEDVHCLDDAGVVAESITPHLRLSVRFEGAEGSGSLRELGLFAQASGERNSGTLLSYFMHAAIEKTAGMSLERSLRLDLTPRAVGGAQPTRHLGNSHSREVHDLENLKTACQVGEIGFDRRIFFGTMEQAVELGYDRCAFCFGRAQSKR